MILIGINIISYSNFHEIEMAPLENVSLNGLNLQLLYNRLYNFYLPIYPFGINNEFFSNIFLIVDNQEFEVGYRKINFNNNKISIKRIN